VGRAGGVVAQVEGRGTGLDNHQGRCASFASVCSRARLGRSTATAGRRRSWPRPCGKP
jgi:hypothetical protein